jgi:hypothetical protein
MNLDELLVREPINKLARVVTSQPPEEVTALPKNMVGALKIIRVIKLRIKKLKEELSNTYNVKKITKNKNLRALRVYCMEVGDEGGHDKCIELRNLLGYMRYLRIALRGMQRNSTVEGIKNITNDNIHKIANKLASSEEL